MSKMLFLLSGAPATGKTTLAKRLVSSFGEPNEYFAGLVPLTGYSNAKIIQIGRSALEFGGSDTVQLRAILPAYELICGAESHYFVEGNKFSNMKFLDRVIKAGYETFCVSLDLSDEKLYARRLSRIQSKNWQQGQTSKARRFAVASSSLVLDAGEDVEVLHSKITSTDFWSRFCE